MEHYFTLYTIPILGGALFFCAAWLFARWLSWLVRHVLNKSGRLDTSIVDLISRVLLVSILILAGIATLDEFGVQVSSLVAALGIFGFAIAIGMRSTTTNFFTGVMIFILKPFKVGDYIDAERVEGVVESISLFHTVVVTDDGEYASVPNGPLWARSIRNMSRQRPRKVALEIAAERGMAFSEMAAIIQKTIAAEKGISKTYPPSVYLKTVTAKSLTARVNFWCGVETAYDLRTGMTAKILEALTAAGVTVTKIGLPAREKPDAAKKTLPPLPPVEDEV